MELACFFNCFTVFGHAPWYYHGFSNKYHGLLIWFNGCWKFSMVLTWYFNMVSWSIDIFHGITMVLSHGIIVFGHLLWYYHVFFIVPQFLDIHHGINIGFWTSTMFFWHGIMIIWHLVLACFFYFLTVFRHAAWHYNGFYHAVQWLLTCTMVIPWFVDTVCTMFLTWYQELGLWY